MVLNILRMIRRQGQIKIVASSLSTASLDEAIHKMIDILNEKMDKLVAGVRFTHVEFYKLYNIARNPVEPAYRSTTETK